MAKITIIAGSIIYVGEERVGQVEGRSEVYVLLKNKEGVEVVVARFKYRSPKASAVHWLKFILAHMTSIEIVEALKDRTVSPLPFAEKLGYVSFNMLRMQKAKAEADARQARYSNVNFITI